MLLSELPYPQRLVVEMLNFAIWSCEKTKDLQYSEIKQALFVFFTDEEISEAQRILEGR